MKSILLLVFLIGCGAESYTQEETIEEIDIPVSQVPEQPSAPEVIPSEYIKVNPYTLMFYDDKAPPPKRVTIQNKTRDVIVVSQIISSNPCFYFMETIPPIYLESEETYEFQVGFCITTELTQGILSVYTSREILEVEMSGKLFF